MRRRFLSRDLEDEWSWFGRRKCVCRFKVIERVSMWEELVFGTRFVVESEDGIVEGLDYLEFVGYLKVFSGIRDVVY